MNRPTISDLVILFLLVFCLLSSHFLCLLNLCLIVCHQSILILYLFVASSFLLVTWSVVPLPLDFFNCKDLDFTNYISSNQSHPTWSFLGSSSHTLCIIRIWRCKMHYNFLSSWSSACTNTY